VSGVWTFRLNAGDETRIQADNGKGISLTVCDIKCGGMSGRTVREGEQIAADIVVRYNVAPELVDAATALASDVQDLLDCREDCGEWGSECPLQDAHKPDGTVERLQRLLDVLAKIGGAS
jgi:hypothetical protein